jgi:hypothetical protein
MSHIAKVGSQPATRCQFNGAAVHPLEASEVRPRKTEEKVRSQMIDTADQCEGTIYRRQRGIDPPTWIALWQHRNPVGGVGRSLTADKPSFSIAFFEAAHDTPPA